MGNKSARAVTPQEKALQHMLTRQTTLRADMFELAPAAHHGVPSNTKTMAFCSLQGLLAVGTASGAVKLYGKDGLEMLLEAPRSQSNLTVGVVHMKFTAQQRLVVTYSNSSIRIYNLSNLRSPEVQVPETWTLHTITCIETITYSNFPFIFVAIDDGSIHVLHEETGKASTYVITPRDCGVSTTEDERHLQVVSAMAVNPRDPNQLLIAYEVSPMIYQWDLAKRKLTKDFSLAKSKVLSSSSQEEPNSVLSLSWHSSGKRFVAGFKYGGFGVFRYDKPHGLYHTVSSSPSRDPLTPISHIQWICAPPTSRHSHLPGAVIFSGGRTEEDAHLLTIVFPSRDVSDEDAITAFVKSEQLTWLSFTIQAADATAIQAFAVSTDQVDHCPRLAPFSAIMLSGNPLDGHQPTISIQSLPCFVRLREEDKEDWEWIPERTPRVTSLPPPFLQSSPIKSSTTVALDEGNSLLQNDLFASMDRGRIDPVYNLMLQEDFEWPINGGSISEPMLKGFMQASGQNQQTFQSATLLLTGHANGFVLFWEIHAPAERSSRGTLKLLHAVDVAGQLTPVPANTEISCICFCRDSRVLMVGFTGGEFAMLEFGKKNLLVKKEKDGVSLPDTSNIDIAADKLEGGNDVCIDEKSAQDAVSGDSEDSSIGYFVVFSLHIHSSEIKKISFSTTYEYAAVADDAGVVSLIELDTRNYELLIFDISSDEPVSVDALLLSEVVEVTDIPVPSAVTASGSTASKSGSRSPPSRSPVDRRSLSSQVGDQMVVIQHREVVPVLFVGRGDGKLEMFHVQTAKKIGESVVDSQKIHGLTSAIMIDSTGRPVRIRGKTWQCQDSSLSTNVAADDISIDMKPEEHTKLIVSAQAFDATQYVLADAISRAAESEIKTFHSTENRTEGQEIMSSPTKWKQINVIETRVPAGSLGLHLFTQVQDHAVVKGFVLENEKAIALAAQGVAPGHVIVSINGVDLLPYSRGIVCTMLEKLLDQEKVMVFAQGFGPLPETGTDPEVGTVQDALTEKPRLLLCTCGKSVHLVPATLPKASEMASVQKEELAAQPFASISVSAPIVVTALVRVPVRDHIEYCVVLIDQSNRLYVVSLLTLTMVWSADVPSLGSALDGIHCVVTASGELIIANVFGEIERLTLFSEPVHKENALLESSSVKTRVWLEERSYPFEKEHQASPKKKSGIAVLKKLVTGSKELHDLNKVFHFSIEEDQRRQLMGDRKSVSGANGEAEDEISEKKAVKKTAEGLGATKEALNQATQHLQERGEKLSELAVKTEQMRDTAEDFYKTMKAFNDKNASKKWYEF